METKEAFHSALLERREISLTSVFVLCFKLGREADHVLRAPSHGPRFLVSLQSRHGMDEYFH
jgi:hypothetical protein